MKHVKLFEQFLNEGVIDNIINFFKPLKPGRVVVRDKIGSPSATLYMLVESPKDAESNGDLYVKVFQIGSIQKNANGKPYASLIHNTKDNIVGIRLNNENFESFRRLTKQEVNLCKDALNSDRVDVYLDNIKKKTKLMPSF